MKLYYSPGACSLSVHITLEEIGAKFNLEKVDKNNKTAEHLKANPLGTVPTFISEDGKPLSEAVAVLQFLADQYPIAGLAPMYETWDRAKFHETLNFLSTEIHKSFGPFFSVAKYDFDQANTKKFLNVATENLNKRLKILDDRLANSNYLCGSGVTVADFYLFVMLRWPEKLNLSLEPFKNLQSFKSRIGERPAVKKAIKSEGLA